MPNNTTITIENKQDANEYTYAIKEILSLAEENGFNMTLYMEDLLLWVTKNDDENNSSYADLSSYRGEW